ncbi:hypothetical protein EKO27_g8670 [Xylaria grammica]|uniref:Uncharacterized protein n=1 Tax=Xylaria grammica TaxID=363999 RepID=A0A439CW37_9PEZI|nr:hypothetical protein EKO27_g8670 [Xylaria grammica]
MSQRPVRNILGELPLEVLLRVVDVIRSNRTRIQLALAFPEFFLAPGFNILRQDASYHLIQGNLVPKNVVSTDPDKANLPLFYTAIDTDVGLDFIREILVSAVSINPTSIDGIWGNTTFVPPLSLAISLGRPDLVALLLDVGANHSILYRNQHFLGLPQCAVQGTHIQCQVQNPIYSVNPTRITSCLTPILEAIAIARAESQRREVMEDCALILHARGARVPWRHALTTWGIDIIDEDLQQQLMVPLRIGWARFVRAILEPLVEFRITDPTYVEIVHRSLKTACSNQPADDYRGVIETLTSLGTRMIGEPLSPNTPIRISTTSIDLAMSRNHLKTAAFLIDKYTSQNISLDYDFNLSYFSNPSGLLSFVQAFWRGTSLPNCYWEGRPYPMHYFREHIFREIIRIGIRGVVEEPVYWMVSQGFVATPWHVRFAMDCWNPAALHALLECGLSPDVGPEEGSVCPLEYCLNPRRLDELYILISHGANPALVSLETRVQLRQQFLQMTNLDYDRSYLMMTDEMLQPEYFSNPNNPERERAAYHYIVGLNQ